MASRGRAANLGSFVVEPEPSSCPPLPAALNNHNLKRNRKECKSEKKKKDGKSKKRRTEEFDSYSRGFIEGSKTEDDIEFSDSNQEDLGIVGQSISEDQEHLSSFNLHLEHTLTKEEIENQKNYKFKWEIPAIGKSRCTWRGTGEKIAEDLDGNSFVGLTPKLYEHLMDIYKTHGDKDMNSPQQKMFFSLCNSYRDILYSTKRPRGLENKCIMDAYIMHTLNHVFRTRYNVKKKGAKLAKLGESDDSDRFRDQGFTRPKVLILLPYASNAYRVVMRLIQLTPSTSTSKVNYEDMVRFSTKFGSGELEGKEDKMSFKPSNYQLLSGGNGNDSFMIGIKFIRDKIKLFSDFHTSDIIVASVQCLANKIEEARSNKEEDVDFLSSIEILIIDHADAIAMQNWCHVNMIIKHLNRLPSKPPRTDVMRIRPWYLDGHAGFYRQTIILSSILNPEKGYIDVSRLLRSHVIQQDIDGSFINQCYNYEGKVKLVHEYKGVLHKVHCQIQFCIRFDVDSPVNDCTARFDFFVKKVYPRIKDSDQGGIMIFINSYYDITQVRRFLKSQKASFCEVSEYNTQSERDIYSSWFNQRKKKIVLYTERSLFYFSCKIREVQNLFIYSLPERSEFYPKIVNMLDGSDNMTCTVMFSRWDKIQLEGIFGTAKAKRMVSAEDGLFIFKSS